MHDSNVRNSSLRRRRRHSLGNFNTLHRNPFKCLSVFFWPPNLDRLMLKALLYLRLSTSFQLLFISTEAVAGFVLGRCLIWNHFSRFHRQRTSSCFGKNKSFQEFCLCWARKNERLRSGSGGRVTQRVLRHQFRNSFAHFIPAQTALLYDVTALPSGDIPPKVFKHHFITPLKT